MAVAATKAQRTKDKRHKKKSGNGFLFVPFVPFRGCGLVLAEGVVRIAIQPAFAPFGRRYHWMTARSRMLCCMSIRWAVAATRRATLLTGAQVHPTISGFYTLLTNPLLRLFDLSNRVDVSTNLHSH